jgi:hypothetical protein
MLRCLPLQDGLEPWLQLDAEDNGTAAGFGRGNGFAQQQQQQQPAAGPWDQLAIVRKLLAAVGPQLTACK